jgi:hypothetical protein
MRKILITLFVLVLLTISGCTKAQEDTNSNYYFYAGQSNTWLATYTISKVNTSYYDSLCVQYLFSQNVSEKNTDLKIGPIEYKLVGNSLTTQSSHPQKLQGVANFHTGSRMNAEIVKVSLDKEIALTIKWQGKSESIKLKKLN